MTAVPRDARNVMLLALAMPLAMGAWILMPTLDLARIVLSLGVASIAFGVGWQVESRLPQGWVGYSVQAGAIAAAVCFFTVLATTRYYRLPELWVIEVSRVAGTVQMAQLAVGWWVLVAVRRRWLSRSTAVGGALFATVVLVWFGALILWFPIGAAVRYWWVEPLLGAGLAAWVAFLLARWRQAPVNRTAIT